MLPSGLHVINLRTTEPYTWQRCDVISEVQRAAGDVASVPVIVDPKPHNFRTIGVDAGNVYISGSAIFGGK